jgi:hypothetical protein
MYSVPVIGPQVLNYTSYVNFWSRIVNSTVIPLYQHPLSCSSLYHVQHAI